MKEAGPAFLEVKAGGFSRKDGTVQFYTRVNALLEPHHTVLDLGAGRGEWTEDHVAYRRELRRIQGKVRETIGADIDPVVSTHPAVDRHVVMDDVVTIPLEDESVDVIVSDHTFEHVAAPEELVASMRRVIRPGGWLCARTPNRFGMIGVAASLVPNKQHRQWLSRLQPGRQERDVFPTLYKMNTRRTLVRLFPAHEWDLIAYTFSAEPAYFGNSRRAIKAVDAIQSRLPSGLGTTWCVFARRL